MKYYQQPVSAWDVIWARVGIKPISQSDVMKINRNIEYAKSRKVWIEG